MIDMRQLRYFVAIVEHGSFSRAAEFLHVAQPALSLHVRKMESDLGTLLLFRTPRGVEPTEAGSILLGHARKVIDQMIVAEEEIRGYKSDPAGDVRLGLPGTISQIFAVPLIRAVHSRYPKIRLRIAEAMSGFVQEWMREGRIDLAILYGEAREHGIATEHLLDEELHFFGARARADADDMPIHGDAIAFAKVLEMPLILPADGHGLRSLLQRHAGAAGQVLNTIFDVDSYNNIKALVQEGMGYSILPENAISVELATGKLRNWKIVDPSIRRSVHLAHASGRPLTNAVAAVLSLARELLQDHALTGRWVGACMVPPRSDTDH